MSKFQGNEQDRTSFSEGPGKTQDLQFNISNRFEKNKNITLFKKSGAGAKFCGAWGNLIVRAPVVISIFGYMFLKNPYFLFADYRG